MLLAVVDLDMLQVHAHDGAARFAAIRERTGLPVIAVVSVADSGDLAAVPAIRKASDGLLFDCARCGFGKKPGLRWPFSMRRTPYDEASTTCWTGAGL